MTGPSGNSEFCFPETLNVPRGEAEGNIDLFIPPDSKIEKAPKKNYLVEAIAYTGCAPKIERLPNPTCSIKKSR